MAVRVCVIGLCVLGITGATGCSSDSTDCFAYFPSKQAGERADRAAETAGFDTDEPEKVRATWGLRMSSGETGDDAEDFRSEVRRLVAENGGKMEKGDGCGERPYFN